MILVKAPFGLIGNDDTIAASRRIDLLFSVTGYGQSENDFEDCNIFSYLF